MERINQVAGLERLAKRSSQPEAQQLSTDANQIDAHTLAVLSRDFNCTARWMTIKSRVAEADRL